MTMNVDTPKDSPVMVMTRTFDAPRDIVWTALTDPRHVTKWYGGSAFTGSVRSMDVRPGGIWSHTLRMKNGAELEMDFVYVEVSRPERLSWKNHGPPRPGFLNVLQQVTLEDMGDTTIWRLVSTFESIADRDLSITNGFAHVIEAGCEVLEGIVIAEAAA